MSADPEAATANWRSYADLEPQLRRALLRADRDDAVIQDRIDCAELAAAAGLPEQATALYGLILLELGAVRGRQLLAAANARLELWPDLSFERPMLPVGFPVDLARAELKALVGSQPRPAGLPAELNSVLPMTAAPLPAAAPTPLPVDRLLAAQATGWLRALPVRMAAGAGWAEPLRGLAEPLIATEPTLLKERVDASLEMLIELLLLRRLRLFVVANAALLGASAERDLFEWSATLNPAAFGAWFANAGMIFRTARDIPALYEDAADGTEGVEDWCVLASAHLPEPMLLDLVEELGDRGMIDALITILLRTSWSDRAHRPLGLVWRLRDAAIDLGAAQLARRAQALVVRWRWFDANERLILGDIAATFGDEDAARAAYESAFLVDPNSVDAIARLDKLAEGEPAHLDHGFSSSPARRRLRLARAAALSAVLSA